MPFDGFWQRWINYFEELFQNVNVIQSVAFSHENLPGRNIHQNILLVVFYIVIYIQAKSMNYLFTVSLHCILTVLTHRRIGLLRQSESISADQKGGGPFCLAVTNCLLLSTTLWRDMKKSNPFSGKGMRHKSKPHHAHTIWNLKAFHSIASPHQGPAKSQPIRNFWSFY